MGLYVGLGYTEERWNGVWIKADSKHENLKEEDTTEPGIEVI